MVQRPRYTVGQAFRQHLVIDGVLAAQRTGALQLSLIRSPDVLIASARQIHAAMNLHAAGEQECAITLAAAAEGMLVEPDEPAFRQKVKDFAATLPEAEGSQKPNDFINWLKHGTYNGKKCDTATIDDIEAPVTIWRAITKFYAVYKAVTPEMEKWQQTMKQKLSAEKAVQANVNSADTAPAAKP